MALGAREGRNPALCRRSADLRTVDGDEGVGPHVHELDATAGKVVDQLGDARGIRLARVVYRNRGLDKLDPARFRRLTQLFDIDDGVLLERVVDHAEALEITVGAYRLELGRHRSEKRGAGHGTPGGLEALDDPGLKRIGHDGEHTRNSLDVGARLRPFPRPEYAQRRRSAEGMDEIRLGGADLLDDLRDPASIPGDVAPRIAHPYSPLAHVGAKAVLDIRLAAPRDQEHVKGPFRGLGGGCAGEEEEARRRKPQPCRKPYHAGTSRSRG